MKKYTFNAITETHGEEIGLLYENLVNAITDGADESTDIYVLTAYVSSPDEARNLVRDAREHAKQEIEYANSHKALTRAEQDILEALDEIDNILEVLQMLKEREDAFMALDGHTRNEYINPYNDDLPAGMVLNFD